MKKTLAVLLAAIMGISTVACSAPASETTAAARTETAAQAEAAAQTEAAAEATAAVEEAVSAAAGAVDMTIDEMIANYDKELTIGICFFNYANNWASWQRNAMLNWFDQCENENIKYYMADGQNDQAKQNDAVDTMIARGIDVLICYVVQSTGATAIAEKCQNAGIPVVFLNTKVDVAALDNFERSWFIGADNESKAHLQMDMIFELLDDEEKFADIDKNGDGKINMVYVQGPPNEDMAICYQTVKDRIASSEYKDTLILLEQQNSDNSSAHATRIAEAWIGKYGDDIELSLAHTDAQAAGTIAAYQAAGLLSEEGGIYVLASNCLPDAQQFIKDGIQYASVLTDPWWQGTTCLKMACAAAMGNDLTYGNLLYGFDDDVKFSEKHEKIVYIVLTGITKDNVDIAADAYGKSTRVE